MAIVNQDNFKILENQIPDFELNDYYISCIREINRIGLNSKFEKVFDFYMYSVLTSMGVDVSPKVKKLIKSLEITSDELVLYSIQIRSLCSNLLGVSSKYLHQSYSLEDLYSCVDDNSSCCAVIFVKYYLFLAFTLDVVFGNKKIFALGKNLKYKDLNNFDTYRSDKNVLDLLSGLVKQRGESSIAISNYDILNIKTTFLASEYILNNTIKEELSHYKYDGLSWKFITTLYSFNLDCERACSISDLFLNLLKRRRYLIPNKGIHIFVEKDNVNMDVFERILDGDVYIICLLLSPKKPELDLGNEVLNTVIINVTKGYSISNGFSLYQCCNTLYKFYGLDKYASEIYGELYVKDPIMYYSLDVGSVLKGDGIEVGVYKGTSAIYDDYFVEIPYYWRYKENNYHKNIKDSLPNRVQKQDVEVYVFAYKRKLPIGQKASDEAIELAKRYSIVLEEGETIVRPFVRKYKTNIKE